MLVWLAILVSLGTRRVRVTDLNKEHKRLPHEVGVKQLGSQQTTVLMATHDLYRAKEVSSHIGIMRQGRLVETVKPSDVSHTELEAIALRSMQF